MITSRNRQIVVLQRDIVDIQLIEIETCFNDQPCHSCTLRQMLGNADLHVIVKADIPEAVLGKEIHRSLVVICLNTDILTAALVQLINGELIEQLALMDDAVAVGELAQLIEDVAGDHDRDHDCGALAV